MARKQVARFTSLSLMIGPTLQRRSATEQIMTLGIRPYDHGLTDLGNGGYAWLQPDGGWGWSNAGLIVSGDASLVIDTLFDKSLTQTMLDAMRRAEPRATQAFDLLVNTHSNGDHCNGNELVNGAEIVASTACAQELSRQNPEMMLNLMAQAPHMGDMGEMGEFAGVDEPANVVELFGLMAQVHKQRRR